MLDHAERRRILEQPAGKHLVPDKWLAGTGALFNEDLDESANFRRLLPRGSFFASAQLHKDIANPPRFTAFEHDVLFDIVALVQQAKRGHAILHRGAKLVFHYRAAVRTGGQRLWHFGCLRFGNVFRLAFAAGQCERRNRGKGQRPLHASGFRCSHYLVAIRRP